MDRCGQCGHGFAKHGKHAGKRWGRFCSTSCAERGKRKHWSKTMNYSALDADSARIYYAWDAIVRHEDAGGARPPV